MPVLTRTNTTGPVIVSSATSPVIVTAVGSTAAMVAHLSDKRAHVHGATPLSVVAGILDTPITQNDYFTATLTEPTMIANPTGTPIDGQRLLWGLTQGGGGTITLDTSFKLGQDIAGVAMGAGVGLTDYLGAMYVAATDEWRVLAYLRGY